MFIMASEEHLSDAPEVLPEGPQGDNKVDPKENYPKESGDARHFLEQQLARVKAQAKVAGDKAAEGKEKNVGDDGEKKDPKEAAKKTQIWCSVHYVNKDTEEAANEAGDDNRLNDDEEQDAKENDDEEHVTIIEDQYPKEDDDGDGDGWRTCVKCGVYEMFQWETDECCWVTSRGKRRCVFLAADDANDDGEKQDPKEDGEKNDEETAGGSAEPNPFKRKAGKEAGDAKENDEETAGGNAEPNPFKRKAAANKASAKCPGPLLMKRELDIVLPPPPPVPKKLKREQNIVKQEAGTLDPAEGDDFEDNVEGRDGKEGEAKRQKTGAAKAAKAEDAVKAVTPAKAGAKAAKAATTAKASGQKEKATAKAPVKTEEGEARAKPMCKAPASPPPKLKVKSPSKVKSETTASGKSAKAKRVESGERKNRKAALVKFGRSLSPPKGKAVSFEDGNLKKCPKAYAELAASQPNVWFPKYLSHNCQWQEVQITLEEEIKKNKKQVDEQERDWMFDADMTKQFGEERSKNMQKK